MSSVKATKKSAFSCEPCRRRKVSDCFGPRAPCVLQTDAQRRQPCNTTAHETAFCTGQMRRGAACLPPLCRPQRRLCIQAVSRHAPAELVSRYTTACATQPLTTATTGTRHCRTPSASRNESRSSRTSSPASPNPPRPPPPRRTRAPPSAPPTTRRLRPAASTNTASRAVFAASRLMTEAASPIMALPASSICPAIDCRSAPITWPPMTPIFSEGSGWSTMPGTSERWRTCPIFLCVSPSVGVVHDGGGHGPSLVLVRGRRGLARTLGATPPSICRRQLTLTGTIPISAKCPLVLDQPTLRLPLQASIHPYVSTAPVPEAWLTLSR